MVIIRLIWESIRMAVQSVTLNRLRALLTLLGITIGIFAIISVFTIVDSLDTNIRESFNSLGSDIIYVQRIPWTFEEGGEFEWWKYYSRPLTTVDEYEYLRDQTRTAEAVCIVSAAARRIEYYSNSVDGAYLLGVSDGFQDIWSVELAGGRYFSPLESNAGRNVTVLGSDIARELFRGSDPVGKYIELLGRKVMVIGVLKKEGTSAFDQFVMDEMAILPMNFYRGFIDLRSGMSEPELWVKARPNVPTEELTSELTQLLRSYRRLRPSEEDNFALNQTSAITDQLDQVIRVLKVAGFFIGIFSIIVGGFGIANIMFVSVKERTRIIGIQKAVGAKQFFILTQFLFESIMLSLAGGIIGLFIVFLLSLVVSLSTDFTMYLNVNNILLGTGISSFIGLVSGIFPAWQGARMDPVVAMNTTF